MTISKETLQERLEYGSLKETKFIYALNQSFNNNDIVITKTRDKFCCCDFKVKNVKNNKKIFIELKSRTDNMTRYDTFLIGKKKLCNISKNYKDYIVVLVWYDEYKNLFFIRYDDELLNCETNSNFDNSFDIPKIKCHKTDMNGLCDYVNTFLN
jgi:hypothetical protein